MAPLDLYFLLRRHRTVLLVAIVAGIVAGWLTAPGTGGDADEYKATHTLIARGEGFGSLQQMALVATTGEVPVRAAEAVGVPPATITRVVNAKANTDVGALEITGLSTDPQLAENAANAVADVLLDVLSGNRAAEYQRQIDQLEQRVDELRARVAQGAGADPASQAEAQAAQNQLAQTLQQLGALQSQGPPRGVLESVEAAEAGPADEPGIRAPDSKPARAALLGGFGMILGLAAVFALDRLDTRIHTKSGAEAAFGFPVIAEIPPLPAGSHRQLLTEAHPASSYVEAHRGLRSHVALATAANGLREPSLGEGTVILVTSPLAGEGKTTTVAHLAALLGEVGRSTLVVSGDFRRPRLHELFGRERGPGITEVLSGGPNAPDIADLDLETGVKGVDFLTSGAPVTNPAVVVKRAPSMLKVAQGHWDFVLVDSAPLLVANDSVELARAANGVIVLARSGRTTADAATRTAELLRRIEAPVLGIVLIAANENPTAYRYYRKGYYGESDTPGKQRSKRRRRGGPPSPAAQRPRSTGVSGASQNGAWVPETRPTGRAGR